MVGERGCGMDVQRMCGMLQRLTACTMFVQRGKVDVCHSLRRVRAGRPFWSRPPNLILTTITPALFRQRFASHPRPVSITSPHSHIPSVVILSQPIRLVNPLPHRKAFTGAIHPVSHVHSDTNNLLRARKRKGHGSQPEDKAERERENQERTLRKPMSWLFSRKH